MNTETKRAAPLHRDGQAPAKPEGKQMHHQNSVLDTLTAELIDVTLHGIAQWGSQGVQISAFVTADHVGEHARELTRSGVPVPGAAHVRCVDGDGPTFVSALEDVLQKIALAAPQQVPA